MTDMFGSPIDIRAYADLRRDQLRDTSSCAGCGSREPARIEGNRCSDCSDWPRCAVHHGWLPCLDCEAIR
jgi:hypothetical protein